MAKFTSFRTLLLCGGAAFTLATPVYAQDSAPQQSTMLDELIVTATKREENVRDISGSISAISGEQLQAIGAQSYADYLQRVPGVVFSEFQPGTSHAVIRGVATSSGNVQGQGTTGYYINDVPLTEPGWTIVIPDIDAFDVDRVEVLRGPQGALFGSASMGGAINYVANEADDSGFDAAIEGTVSRTRNADPSYAAKAMVNIPLVTDQLAVRGVVAYRMEQGYLDNIGTGDEGSSDIAVAGGRMSVVWEPTDATRLSWLSLYQQTEADDAPYRNLAAGELARTTALLEPNDTDVLIHSLRLEQDLGFADFTAIGSYQEKSQDFLFDFTPYRGFYNGFLGTSFTTPMYVVSGGESDGKSLELRLASKGDGPFQWVVGGMYFETSKTLYEKLGADGAIAQFDASTNPLFGPGSGVIFAPDDSIFNAFYTDLDSKEAALFGEASYSFTPEWKLSVGGRLYKTEVSSVSTVIGVDSGGPPSVAPAIKDKQDGFSPKVSLTYTPSEDFMVYGLYSEGFRFGTPNIPGLSPDPIPSGSKSDSLKNYEIGIRSTLLGGNLQLDVTAFYIDWQDIQLRLLTPTPPQVNYAGNGGAAAIPGLEVAASWRLTDKLDLQSSITWMEAEIDEDVVIPGVGTAPKGAQLPGSAEWSLTNTAVYRFGGDYQPTVTFSHRYLSAGISDLNSAVPTITPSVQGDYHIFDLRLQGRFGDTTVTLFGNNLADDRGVTRTLPEANGFSQGLIRPRTFGVTFNWAL